MYLKFVDFGIFLQRLGKKVCRCSCSGIADYSTAAVYYQDRRHIFLYLCLDICVNYISGKSPALFCTECPHVRF